MSDCGPTHCYHIKHQHSNTAGTYITEVCCHCGNEKTEHIPPSDFGPWEYKSPEHGPFEPFKSWPWSVT